MNNDRKHEGSKECSADSTCRNSSWRNRFGGFVGGFIFGLLILFAYYIKVSPSEFLKHQRFLNNGC
jgi:hypothetical protein